MGNDFILIDGSEGQENKEQENKEQENREQTAQGPYGYYQAGQGSGQPYQQTYRPEPPRPPVDKKKKSNGLGRKMTAVIAGGLVFGLVAGVAFQGVNVVGDHFFGTKGAGQEVGTVSMVPAADDTEKDTDVVTNKEKTTVMPVGTASVADVAKNTMPSVVAITSISVQEIPTFDLFGWGGGQTQEFEGESSGSGIIVGENDTELLIATNNHVVEGAKTLSVLFMGEEVNGAQVEAEDLTSEQAQEGEGGNTVGADAGNAVSAQIKGTDVENDLAVIAVKKEEIPKETLAEIKIAQLGSSDDLVVGEQVVAIGNALGYGQSVTSGYVSALDRYVEDMTTPCIQTDAAINPGNSGGALLNMSGQVVGINSAKLADNAVEGMGYAIPISTAMPILDDLMSRVTREKVDTDKASYLGISCKDVSAELNQMYGVPTGVFVLEVSEDGPAARAGILTNDIITSLGGTKVSTSEELTGQLEYYAAGETVEIVLQRAEGGQYKEQKISVTLGNKKDMAS